VGTKDLFGDKITWGNVGTLLIFCSHSDKQVGGNIQRKRICKESLKSNVKIEKCCKLGLIVIEFVHGHSTGLVRMIHYGAGFFKKKRKKRKNKQKKKRK
jgi:hypothetical protein